MILEIDAGNTSLKWRWRGSAARRARDLAQLRSSLAGGPRPEEVLVCNVRSAEFEAALATWLDREWDLRPCFAKVARACGGVTIRYPDPSRLGADRWLAMLAGFRRTRARCLIVDSGTALTIDLLEADGLHLGGYIMPGLASLRSSLARRTAVRPPPATGEESVALGNDTGAAVRNGTLFMLCGAVRTAMERFAREAEASALILTGGDAPLLGRNLGCDGVSIIPDLVLDGLAIARAEAKE